MLLHNLTKETNNIFVKREFEFKNYLPDVKSHKNSTKKIILTLSCLSADASQSLYLREAYLTSVNFYTVGKRG